MGAIFVFVTVQVFQHSLLSIASGELPPEEVSEATISVAIQQGFIVLFVLSLIGGVFFFAIHIFVVVPLGKLHSSIQRVSEQNFQVRLPKGPDNEIGDLFEAFNQMTDRLQESKNREGEVARMKSEFLSITAHQLRTPLSALKWVLYMALEGDVGALKKAQKELLQKGYDSNERMIALVNDLLDVVRIEEGRFDYKFEKGSVSEIAESVAKEIRVIAEKKGVQLLFHKPLRELPKVALDPVKFRLALSNIVGNAVQYTQAKGRVDIELTQKDREILLMVRDTGVGIPKQYVARLFTKFFRGANALRLQPTGSGLGLFIAKNIIEKHGGKIWIESEENKGTSVYFTIPVSGLRK
ncbi:MAG TPA: HAMP domain-containing sensor histidine kinase [Candidatus Paceibacterota bacterium]